MGRKESNQTNKQILHWGMMKTYIGFGDLALIFKVLNRTCVQVIHCMVGLKTILFKKVISLLLNRIIFSSPEPKAQR